MKNLILYPALILLIGFASTASADWGCAPQPVVYNYWPAAPAYTYSVASPVVVNSYQVPTPVVVQRPYYVTPAPVYYRAVYRPVWVPGQPVRNMIRRGLP
jgi:hypothetical protein